MKFRKQLINWLFIISQKIYTQLFKKHQPWNIHKKDLLQLPKDSFGYHLGSFLQKNGFELIPKVERHDAYHVLTGYSTNVEDEIALQWLCFGNGKRSKYMYGVIILGTVILPDYYQYYKKSYRKGKQANTFHHLDYKELLQTPIEDLRRCFFTNEEVKKLRQTQLDNSTI
ncbi:Coq4 family protein [Pseudofulvibacter geojedonensis]|uniref:Coq4 family protein n=1 Tax=Pseudofulvibacter geojedonensis TaxID=1123758 RepID=A0ABW3I6L1_9FLAO